MVAAVGATASASAQSQRLHVSGGRGTELSRGLEQTVAQRHAPGWAPLATPATDASRPAHRLSQEQRQELRRQITEQAAHENIARPPGNR